MTTTKKVIIGIVIAVLAFIGASYACGQDKFEHNVGYQFVRVNPTTSMPSFTFNKNTDSHGVNVGTTYYVNKVVGVSGEVGANFGDTSNTSSRLVTALGGLTFKANKDGTFQPFARALGGLSYQRDTNCGAVCQARPLPTHFSKSDTSGAFAFGVGLDAKFGKRFGWRVISADYLKTYNFGQSQNNLRLGTGLIF